MRDEYWLKDRLKYLWVNHFADARAGLPITVRFGQAAQYRFGSIRQKGETCLILINGLFALQEVPDYVIDATLAHELAHYVHGYGSGLRKLHAHPHRGGIIDSELEKRGCAHLEKQAGAWRKQYWAAHYQKYQATALQRKAARTEQFSSAWKEYLSRPGKRSIDEIESRLSRLTGIFGVAEPRFRLDWLHPSMRRTGLSYWYRKEEIVRLHPLLADPAVPWEIVDYELAYWIAQHISGTSWERINAQLARAGLADVARKAITWRSRTWPRFLRGHRIS
jgi:hypothetical protein